MVQLNESLSIGVEERAIGLEMDRATRAQHLEIATDEARGGQALRHLLHLGVGEGNPDLIDFSRSEEARQGLDLPTQEGDIRHTRLVRSLRTRPDASALDVHTDEVLLWIQLTETYGVLALTTAELQDDGAVVVEEVLTPASTQGEGLLLQTCERILEHMGEGLHLGELRQLVLSHRRLVEEVNALAVLELTLHDEADLVGIELPYPILLGIAHDIVDQLVLIDLDGLFVVGIIVTQIATALVVVVDEVYEVNDIIIGEELLELLGDIVADEGHRSGIIISKQFVFYHNIYREGLAQ